VEASQVTRLVQAHFIQESDDLAIVANHILKAMPMPEVIASRHLKASSKHWTN
jgi:hypothetical protein